MSNLRVDEGYLTRLIDDLQQDHNTLFNEMKTSGTAGKEKGYDLKLDRQTKIISSLMNNAMSLKTLKTTIKKKII